MIVANKRVTMSVIKYQIEGKRNWRRRTAFFAHSLTFDAVFMQER